MMITEIGELLNIIDITTRFSHKKIYIELEDKSQLYTNLHIQDELSFYINNKVSFGFCFDMINAGNPRNTFNIIYGKLFHWDVTTNTFILQRLTTVLLHKVKMVR
jgi:hypothetical protein